MKMLFVIKEVHKNNLLSGQFVFFQEKKNNFLYYNEHKAKKKNTLSQSLREFFKPTRHAFFFYFILFYFITSIGLCLHAHAKPKMTEKFQLPYFQKSNRILHVF